MMKRLKDKLGMFVPWGDHWGWFLFVQWFTFWFYSLFCRVSNHEKKLEAVRSGVRAISVSGKMETVLWTSNSRRPPSSVVPSTVFLYLSISRIIFCSLPISLSLIQLPLFTSFSSFFLAALTSIHVLFFPTGKLVWSSPPDWLQTKWHRHLLSQPGHDVSSSPLSSVQIHHPMVSSAFTGPLVEECIHKTVAWKKK